MKNKVRKNIISALSIAALSCAFVAISVNGTTAKADVLSVDFTMQEGAEIRLVENSNGIRFAADMAKDDYDELMADATYDEVSFGMVIVPADYLTTGFELTEEKVFGADAAFSSTITENTASQKMIIDLPSPVLYDFEGDGEVMSIYGAIVNLDENNLEREYVGRAYVKYKLAGESDYAYRFASYFGDDIENNTRSMTYVAQLAINVGDDTNGSIKSTYVDSVSHVETPYEVHYFFEDAEGNFVEDAAKKIEETAGIGTQLDLSADNFEGYSLNAQSTSDLTVYANGKTLVNRYYERIDGYTAGMYVNGALGTTLEFQYDGEFAGTVKYSDPSGGHDNGHWSDYGIMFSATKNVQSPNWWNNEFVVAGYKYLKLDVYVESGTTKLTVNADGNDTAEAAGYFTPYSATYTIGTEITATSYLYDRATGEATNLLSEDKWYTVVLPLQFGEGATSSNLGAWFNLSIFAWGGTEAAPSVWYVDNLSFETTALPDPWEYKYLPVANSGEGAYACSIAKTTDTEGDFVGAYGFKTTKTNSWVSSIQFINSDFRVVYTQGASYISMKLYVDSNVTSIQYKDNMFTNSVTHNETITVGQEFSTTYIKVYDLEGNAVNVLNANTWYEVVLKVSQTSYVGWGALELAPVLAQCDTTNGTTSVWFKDCKLHSSNPHA